MFRRGMAKVDGNAYLSGTVIFGAKIGKSSAQIVVLGSGAD